MGMKKTIYLIVAIIIVAAAFFISKKSADAPSVSDTTADTATVDSIADVSQEALNVCSGKASNASCSFTSGQGETVSGTCETPPNASMMACVAAGM
jgi:hypothetical protein